MKTNFFLKSNKNAPPFSGGATQSINYKMSVRHVAIIRLLFPSLSLNEATLSGLNL